MLEDTEFVFDDVPKLWEQQKEENPLFLVEGFISEPKEKQAGGKYNRLPLMRHKILIDIEKLILKGGEKNYARFMKGRTMKGIICGYNRLTKEKIEISTLEIVEIFKNEKTNFYLPQGREEWFCIFDNLIVKESSHHYGQHLFLKFTFEFNDKIYSIESSNFETISKRAVEKSVQKKFKNETNSSILEKQLLKIEPSIGLKGGIVRVFIANLEHNDSIFIYFGNTFIEKYSIFHDSVVFETPLDCDTGKLIIRISLDNGLTFLSPELKFECVDQNDERGIQKLVHYLIQTTNDKINKSMPTQISLENMINKYL